MRNEELAEKSLSEFQNEADLHLWLADLVKELDFESYEKEDGAKQLVEKVAYRLGTHGRQIFEDIADKEGDSQ